MPRTQEPQFPSWRPRFDRAAIAPGELHVIRFTLAATAGERDRLLPLLAPEEQERAARFHFAEDRDRYVVGRGTLRRLLGGLAGEAPAALRFVYGPQEKPALAGAALAFNLSHADDAALLAVARDCDLGVDVEREREEIEALDLAGRFFSPLETAALSRLPVADRRAAFFRCWTRKEAFIKAIGQGLSCPLGDFDVTFADPDEPPRLTRVAWDAAEVDRFTLFDLKPFPGFAGALAVRAPAPAPRRWQLWLWDL